MSDIELSKITTENGEEEIVAMKCEINGRKFIITNSRKIFEDLEGQFKECTADDEETAFLKKYTAPSTKSMDIEMDETR